jgi:hypothetical protein
VVNTDRPIVTDATVGAFTSGVLRTGPSRGPAVSRRPNPIVQAPEVARVSLNDHLVTALSAQGLYSPNNALVHCVLGSSLLELNKQTYAEGPLRLMYLEALEQWFSQKQLEPYLDPEKLTMLSRVGLILQEEFKQCERWLSIFKELPNE